MEIVWTDVALNGLDRARGYIGADNPDAAQRVYAAIFGAAKRLGDLPEIGRPGRVDGTRELVVSKTPYLITYSVIEKRVVIVAVQHGAQEWPQRF